MYDDLHHGGGWGLGTWITMGLMMLAFWGLLAALVVYLFHNLAHHQAGQVDPRGPDTGQRILDERLARGEIEADDYRQRSELLRSR